MNPLLTHFHWSGWNSGHKPYVPCGQDLTAHCFVNTGTQAMSVYRGLLRARVCARAGGGWHHCISASAPEYARCERTDISPLRALVSSAVIVTAIPDPLQNPQSVTWRLYCNLWWRGDLFFYPKWWWWCWWRPYSWSEEEEEVKENVFNGSSYFTNFQTSCCFEATDDGLESYAVSLMG